MEKRILVLTMSALILACGAVVASAQQGPMMQQQQTPQQEQERQLHHPDWFRGMGMMGRGGIMGRGGMMGPGGMHSGMMMPMQPPRELFMLSRNGECGRLRGGARCRR